MSLTELYGRTSRRGQLPLLAQARLSVAEAARQFGVSTSWIVKAVARAERPQVH